jgi:murein DD-endopeptidase MepM/ murein hydrolase activator NlpD
MFLGYPLSRDVQTFFAEWAIFGAPRDYNGDGVYDDKHEGLDFHAVIGDEVLACADGDVIWATNQRFYGEGLSSLGSHIIIEHKGGLRTWYGHLDDMVSAQGDVVLRGEIIGYAGTSGKSTGPHLHLIIQHLGYGESGFVIPYVVDPMDYLEDLNNGANT